MDGAAALPLDLFKWLRHVGVLSSNAVLRTDPRTTSVVVSPSAAQDMLDGRMALRLVRCMCHWYHTTPGHPPCEPADPALGAGDGASVARWEEALKYWVGTFKAVCRVEHVEGTKAGDWNSAALLLQSVRMSVRGVEPRVHIRARLAPVELDHGAVSAVVGSVSPTVARAPPRGHATPSGRSNKLPPIPKFTKSSSPQRDHQPVRQMNNAVSSSKSVVHRQVTRSALLQQVEACREALRSIGDGTDATSVAAAVGVARQRLAGLEEDLLWAKLDTHNTPRATRRAYFDDDVVKIVKVQALQKGRVVRRLIAAFKPMILVARRPHVAPRYRHPEAIERIIRIQRFVRKFTARLARHNAGRQRALHLSNWLLEYKDVAASIAAHLAAMLSAQKARFVWNERKLTLEADHAATSFTGVITAQSLFRRITAGKEAKQRRIKLRLDNLLRHIERDAKLRRAIVALQALVRGHITRQRHLVPKRDNPTSGHRFTDQDVPQIVRCQAIARRHLARLKTLRRRSLEQRCCDKEFQAAVRVIQLHYRRRQARRAVARRRAALGHRVYGKHVYSKRDIRVIIRLQTRIKPVYARKVQERNNDKTMNKKKRTPPTTVTGTGATTTPGAELPRVYPKDSRAKPREALATAEKPNAKRAAKK
eukprot:PhM_4_TR334/c1_g1_i1/m.61097